MQGLTQRTHRGWYQVAFERELTGDLTSVRLGELPLVLARTEGGARAFDAICPHRGANLAYGGQLEGETIVCPFHGHRIGLGKSTGSGFRVRGYRTETVGGLIFVLLDERHEHGFSSLIESLEATHFFVQGFKFEVRAAPELVIENGFDRGHFKSVHGLEEKPDLRLTRGCDGELCVEGTFLSASANLWQRDSSGDATTSTPVRLQVFSPNLCVTRLGSDEAHYLVISGATPNGDGLCSVRVSLAIPAQPDGSPPDPRAVRSLLRDSKLAYEQDKAIWENMAVEAPSQLTPEDDLVVEFQRFCRKFLEVGTP